MHPQIPKKNLSGATIIIPLNVHKFFPTDYIPQTAKILQRRNCIVYFDYNHVTSLRTLVTRKPMLQQVWHQLKQLARHRPGTIIEISPIGFLPFQRIALIRQINVIIGIYQLVMCCKILRFERLILWGFHPILALFLRHLRGAFVVYDCLDYYGEELDDGKRLAFLEREIFTRASLVCFNSQALYKKKLAQFPAIKQKSFVLPMGCNTSLFRRTRQQSELMKNIPRPRIIFIGHINYRLNYELIDKLVAMQPLWSFIFVGPVYIERREDVICEVKRKISELNHFPNVYFLGAQPKQSLPVLLGSADVGVIPYDIHFGSVRYCSPMKAYEYLASEKPIVSTKLYSMMELNQRLVKIATTAQEFSRHIQWFIDNWTISDQSLAKKTAYQHRWDKRVSTIEKQIFNKMHYGKIATNNRVSTL